ncbi:MAG TPA: hypothetical protein VGL35_14835 [Rhizomicrobium sp.]|jgi:hypothetical protein
MIRLNPAQLVLSAVCAGLAVLLAFVAFAPLPVTPSTPVQAKTEPTDDTPLPRFDPPSRQAFAAVDDRSVFNPLRVRVSAPFEPGASSASSLPSDLSLVGVILDDKTRLAMFKSPTAPLAVGVPVGGSIEGWQVTRIEPDSVALRASGPEQEISLSSNKPPPVSNAPRPFNPPNFVRQPNFVRNNPNMNNGANNNANNNNNNNNNRNNNDDDDNKDDDN